MVYLIGPDGLANRRFANFNKKLWMTMVHVLRFRIISQNFHTLILNLGMHIIHIHAVFWKFAYPQFTGYAEYIRFCHKEHLNKTWEAKFLLYFKASLLRVDLIVDFFSV